MTSSTVPTEASKNGLSCCSMTPCWPTRPAMDRLLHHAHVIEVTRAPHPAPLEKRAPWEARGRAVDQLSRAGRPGDRARVRRDVPARTAGPVQRAGLSQPLTASGLDSWRSTRA